MTEYTTIRVSKEAYDEAKTAKHERETWNEFIQRLSEEPPRVVEFSQVDESELANEIATQLQLDMAQIASRTADEVERRLR